MCFFWFYNIYEGNKILERILLVRFSGFNFWVGYFRVEENNEGKFNVIIVNKYVIFKVNMYSYFLINIERF